MSTAEQLALAVLKGDNGAMEMLLDSLLQDRKSTAGILTPIHKITVDRKRLRVVAYVSESLGADVLLDRDHITSSVAAWLDGITSVLILQGFSRIELYELQGER